MINGKTAVQEYEMSRMGNRKYLGRAGILFAKKWLERVTDIMRMSNRMIVIKDLIFKRELFK